MQGPNTPNQTAAAAAEKTAEETVAAGEAAKPLTASSALAAAAASPEYQYAAPSASAASPEYQYAPPSTPVLAPLAAASAAGTPLEQRQWQRMAQRTMRLAVTTFKDAGTRLSNSQGTAVATQLTNCILSERWAVCLPLLQGINAHCVYQWPGCLLV